MKSYSCSLSPSKKVFLKSSIDPLKSIRSFNLVFILLVISIQVSAQNSKRIELELDDNFIDATTTPVKEFGFLYQSFARDKSSKNDKYNVSYYSKELVKGKTESMPVKHNAFIFYSYQERTVNYTLFLDKNNYYALVTTDLNSQTSTKTEGELPKLTKVDQFVIVGNYLYLRAIIGKQNSLIQINLTNKKLQDMPIHIGTIRRNDINPQDLQVIDNELLAFVEAETDKKTADLYLLKYNKDGRLQKTINLTKDIHEKIINLEASLIDGKILLAGTFSKTRSGSSQGVFFAELNQDKVINVKFYNFLDLEHFSSTLGNRAQKAVERKKNYSNDKNKELLLNTLTIIHQVEKVKSGYCVIGEIYEPIYVTQRSPTGGMSRVLAGYNYSHAIVLKLDATGNLLWDESLKMGFDVETYNLLRYVSFSETISGDITIAFADRNKINTKTMNYGGTVINENTSDMAVSEARKDKAKRTTTVIEPWYENYFIAYGTQLIPGNHSTKRREIFFIEKLSVE